MNGFLNLLKPPGLTSQAAVSCVKRLLPRGIKIGHMGTLDPCACGVLPIGIGKATRLFDYCVEKTKTYRAEIRLGMETDTQDAAGKVVRTSDIVDAAVLRAVLPRFVGDIWQKTPVYSAVHVEGRRSYDLAREGKAEALPPRLVRVSAVTYLEQTATDRHLIEVTCGKGTYIRQLAVDIAEAAGSCGYLTLLLRTKAGFFDLDTATLLEELSGRSEDWPLTPMDAPLLHLPEARFGGDCLQRAINGNPLPRPEGLEEGQPTRVYIQDAFAGIARPEGETLRFSAMLLER